MSHTENYVIEPIVISDGKYTFFVPEGDYRVHIHRNGEPWVIIEAGSKALGTLLLYYQELQEEVKRLKKDSTNE